MKHQMSMLDRIHQAQFDALQPQEVGGNTQATLTHTDLAELDDMDVVPLGEPNEGDGLLKLTNEVELSMALWTANYLGVNNDMAAIFEKVNHEHEHALAAQALGLRAIYAIRFSLRPSGNLGMKVTTLPVGEQVPKLGLAAMLAYPQRLSHSDLRQIQMIGYKDQYDIAKRIKDNNLDMPSPLSAR